MNDIVEQVKVGSNLYKIVDPITAQLVCDNVETTFYATQTYTAGEYVRINDELYKVTANIASGAPMTVGVNISLTNVGDELTQINSDLDGKLDKKSTPDITITKIGYTNAQQLASLNAQVDFTKITNYSYIKKGVLFYKINQLMSSSKAEYMAETIDVSSGEFDTYCLVFGSSGNYCWHNYGGVPTNDGATASANDIEFYY